GGAVLHLLDAAAVRPLRGGHHRVRPLHAGAAGADRGQAEERPGRGARAHRGHADHPRPAPVLRLGPDAEPAERVGARQLRRLGVRRLGDGVRRALRVLCAAAGDGDLLAEGLRLSPTRVRIAKAVALVAIALAMVVTRIVWSSRVEWREAGTLWAAGDRAGS